jgi:hypothetical protein
VSDDRYGPPPTRSRRTARVQAASAGSSTAVPISPCEARRRPPGSRCPTVRFGAFWGSGTLRRPSNCSGEKLSTPTGVHRSVHRFCRSHRPASPASLAWLCRLRGSPKRCGELPVMGAAGFEQRGAGEACGRRGFRSGSGTPAHRTGSRPSVGILCLTSRRHDRAAAAAA